MSFTFFEIPCDAFQEGNADALACLPVPRAKACGSLSSIFFRVDGGVPLLIIGRNSKECFVANM
jgi:hypothetical protein